ncbi:MAG: carboxy terminal-processing peptidase [Kiritimatiellia bacterium]
MKRSCLIGLILICLAGVNAAVVPQSDAGEIMRLLGQAMPVTHLSHEPLSESLMRRTVDNYLRALDFDRTLLKAEDVTYLRRQAATLENAFKEGDPEFAYAAFELIKERAENRVAFVTKLLDEGFDFEKEESFVWRRKDAPWAKDDAEWDELWRKKVKNEYVGILVSRQIREMEAEEEALEKAEKAEKAQKAAEAAGETDTEQENADETSDGTTRAAEEEASDEAVVTEAAPEADETADEIADTKEDAEEEVDLELNLTPEERIRKRYERFSEVLNGHDSEYVLGAFLSSLAEAYDAHSSYLSPRREEDFDIQMRLSLTGIGAELTYDEGAAKIQRVMKGGPADRDGRLQSGDKIVAVQQEGEEPVDILYWPLYRSVRLIRGEKGSTVILHVIPASDATGTQVRLIDLVRDEIKLEEKEAHSKVYELERDETVRKLGIINLPDFYADFSRSTNGSEPTSSAKDVRRLLEELNEEDVEGLVLDLRNNGGGSLRDCVEMTGFFVDAGPVVQVRSGQRVSAMSDPNRGVVFDKPLVVLVNRLSASASEILAAALQDYGRAVIVGDSKTHGKGSVQTLLPLDRRNDQYGALKVTTAGFYRVDGRSTQLKGVSPDILIRSPTDVMELGEEYLPNVMPWSWVKPLRFSPYGDLRETNTELAKLSMERLSDHEDYQIHQNKVDRLAERVQRREISLNYQERLEQTKEDRELDKLQSQGLQIAVDEEDDDLDAEEEDRRDIRPEKDLILKEGLEILADLVEKG